MATSIQITTTSAKGKKLRKAVSAVNPNASNDVLKTFSRQLNAITTNEYKSTTKISTDECKPASMLTLIPLKYYAPEDEQSSVDVPADGVITVTAEELKNGLGVIEGVVYFEMAENIYSMPRIVSVPEGAAVFIYYDDGIQFDCAPDIYVSIGQDGTEKSYGDVLIYFPDWGDYAGRLVTIRLTA